MIANFLQLLKEFFVFDQRKQDEDYLNESKDIYELEFRMKQLEIRKSKNENMFLDY